MNRCVLNSLVGFLIPRVVIVFMTNKAGLECVRLSIRSSWDRIAVDPKAIRLSEDNVNTDKLKAMEAIFNFEDDYWRSFEMLSVAGA